MKKIGLFLMIAFCLSITSCQLQFKKTGEDTYTLSGVKSLKSVQKEEIVAKQKKLERANFLLDSLSAERQKLVTMYNLVDQIGGNDTQPAMIKQIERIDKQIDYVEKRKDEIQKELKQK